MRFFLFLFLGISSFNVIDTNGQVTNINDLDQQYLNWFNKDVQSGNIAGTGVDKAYSEILKDKATKKTIIVAIIDSGVDIFHEDLEGKIWINEDEIPGNNIDDDHNGYIDDINGWNYIGNADGKNIKYENYEFTRVLNRNNTSDPMFKKAKNLYEQELKKRNVEKENITNFERALETSKSIIKEAEGIDVRSADDLKKVSFDPRLSKAKKFLQTIFDKGFTEASLLELKQRNSEYFSYYLNKDFDARSIVGDNPSDIEDRIYGNADVIGPRSDHGTSVAGVVAAVRNNNIGINGIATDVKIMSIRTVPDGDERDKDVALAIRYAVDNGADIINMSFGKKISPHKAFVDEAVKYAEQHEVLLVHGAGNSGENLDEETHYPSATYLDGTLAKNWLDVGASSLTLDKEIAADFSNYSKTSVDIFAPGVNILSLDSSNTYSINSGTSLSAPVVTGIAALILSYYPDLKPAELIDLILSSSYTVKKPKKVYLPGSTQKKRQKARFSELSKCGGIINAGNALVLAGEKYK